MSVGNNRLVEVKPSEIYVVVDALWWSDFDHTLWQVETEPGFRTCESPLQAAVLA